MEQRINRWLFRRVGIQFQWERIHIGTMEIIVVDDSLFECFWSWLGTKVRQCQADCQARSQLWEVFNLAIQKIINSFIQWQRINIQKGVSPDKTRGSIIVCWKGRSPHLSYPLQSQRPRLLWEHNWQKIPLILLEKYLKSWKFTLKNCSLVQHQINEWKRSLPTLKTD